MEQIFITVKTLATETVNGNEIKTVKCINKDIRDCNSYEREKFYYSQSKGQLMGLLELYAKDIPGQIQ